MEEPTADGAAAAATYFMQLYAYIYATGDTSTWRAMSAQTCEFCLDSATDAETLAAAGSRDLTPVAVTSAEGQELKDDEWFRALLVVTQPPTVEIDSAGNETQTSDGGTFDVTFAMTWSNGWVIDSVGIEPKAAP